MLLTRNRDDLYERIDMRVQNMFHEGVVEEVRALGEAGKTAEQVIGLGEVRSLLKGELTEDECVRKIQQATRAYAKRQLTWFRRQTTFEVVNLSEPGSGGSFLELLADRIGGHPVESMCTLTKEGPLG